MERIAIGIDVGGTSVKLGLFQENGTLLHNWEVHTRKEEAGRFILADVADSIKTVLTDKNIADGQLIGAGVGVPGPVMPDGYVEVCVNLGWRDINAQQELSQMLGGIPVLSGNDANVAALGEMWKGGGKGYTDIVMITLGTGVGGGVIIDEKIISGKHGLAGEIGHIRIRDQETEVCNCGGQGCVEQVASATGIAREARRTMAAIDTPSVLREFGDQVTAKNVLDAAKEGDQLALEVVETISRYLGLLMAQLSMTIDPQMFVVGGGVSKAGQFLIDAIEKYYIHYTPISKHKAKIGLAELGNDAGIYGAAKLILG
ncbi:MAG: ROK family glucokinase [Lachnospiraceae bacterium]